jgi:hypothetical protein
MKSRRRIAFLKAQDHANSVADYSKVLRPAEWGSGLLVQSKNPKSHMSALGHNRT